MKGSGITLNVDKTIEVNQTGPVNKKSCIKWEVIRPTPSPHITVSLL